jgi:hypothetical protein
MRHRTTESTPPSRGDARGLNRLVPWRTAEDGWVLSQLTPEQARALEPLLHRQARSDLRFRQHNISLDHLTC